MCKKSEVLTYDWIKTGGRSGRLPTPEHLLAHWFVPEPTLRYALTRSRLLMEGLRLFVVLSLLTMDSSSHPR
jgi:hypothetical protein